MKTYKLSELTSPEIELLLVRPSLEQAGEMEVVRAIIADVEKRGDQALREYSQKFDRVALDEILVTEKEFEEAEKIVSRESKEALAAAAKNIEAFHAQQKPKRVEVETMIGVRCIREWRSVECVGLYVPGGSAPLVSTVLMLGIPAQKAGCREIILCTPPNSAGRISPEILCAARMVGVSKVFKVGGAQAIAAMACGTESVPKADKIFGPGNKFVSQAKAIASCPPYNTAIDMIAGPSELLVIADDSSTPAWVAADLLSQAEHGADSQVVLITTSKKLLTSVEEEIKKQIKMLPRVEIIEKALEKSFAVLVSTISEAVDFANAYAPEHLHLAVDNADRYLSKIVNAGSVFIDPLSSVVFGDYAAGTNHTLPTGGTARARGGLCVEDFMKPIFIQSVSRAGYNNLSETTKTLARVEGLTAHERAITIRAND